ncbi:phage baseplate assembly protein V [Streptomyces sp. NBC_00237]|uniref:phage baseplate assembly protein V n=1 Tax=Streptomyces sp. NBC_00237 TaxID=2975687 RepID=UPI002257A0AD|nr:phage baseplate assembly protein V [Streptomyces sp. NBC_00237]MCX5205372.1 phage baseplate assembly protein V [Streptomyces sp. NBC_00237]
MSGERPAYYGKFRGVVTHNDGPEGRIRATVPDVYGSEVSPFALPSVPYAGDGVGLHLMPPVGASVWFEFEQGDADRPVWSGCFWGPGQAPAATPDHKVLKTALATVTFDDSTAEPGAPDTSGITITVKGLTITLDKDGIEINAGTHGVITLADDKVTINGDGLEVT